MTVKTHAVSWFFDCSVSPINYAFTVWSSQYTSVDKGVYPHSREDIRISLEHVDSGTVSNKDIVSLVRDTCLEHFANVDSYQVVLENSPQMVVLAEQLKRHLDKKLITLIDRENSIAEQIMKYSLMINNERYFIRQKFLATPDLIFDEFTELNLIDPVCSDDQISFFRTQALLIGCHYWDLVFQPSTFHFASISRGSL